MSLRTCYEAFGGDYDGVLGRLRSERLVQKFVLKFLNEGSFSDLMAALETKDGAAAFRAAHTLKGICLNLSFDKLYVSSNRLCEALRQGWTDEAPGMAKALEQDYQITIAAIQALKEELGL